MRFKCPACSKIIDRDLRFFTKYLKKYEVLRVGKRITGYRSYCGLRNQNVICKPLTSRTEPKGE